MLKNKGLFKSGLRHSARRLLVCCCLCFAAAATASFANSGMSEQEQAKFEEIKRKIDKLKKELEQTKSSRDNLQKELENNEKNIRQLNDKTDELKQELDNKQSKLDDLRSNLAGLNKKKSEQSHLVKDYINAAYRLGQKSELQLLLNQQDPAEVQRMLKYYQSFSSERHKLIGEFAQTVAELKRIEPEIAATTDKLKTTYSALQAERKALRQSQSQRKQTLRKLEGEYSNQQHKLAGLKSDRQRLEKLLNHVYEEINAQELSADISDFAKLKGRLPKPTNGKTLNRYGSRRAGSQLSWQGLEFAASKGSKIIAVHHGQVVFSDYLRGHGLLLVVDHGNGYMSLYAHADKLYKDIGEWVEAGETIASVGNTGGRRDAALYFELRHNGKPTNPNSWFKRA
ncbi:murein hydrolase activator EnvC family protein [Agaribacterium haliotis]|uniref:murein hydrolase activator EnvC family protein n=1 Tax=Agaribacterium haliotis TaxID=2013869 RepID=UPI000BB5662A|nr:peptidoglycan DD-metalloendopeptidase family protein [Agaribacterium haliotis]